MTHPRAAWRGRAGVLALAGLFLVGGPAAAQPARPFEWQEARPESQGMSAERLNALWKDLEARRTTGLLIIRNDRIVFEKYAAGWDASRPHYTASMAKALVGGLALALALGDGRIALDDPAAKYIPQWKDDPRKSKITIRHLGSHTSGLDDSRPNEEAKWKDDFWKRLDPPNDPFTISRDRAPVLFEPGTKFHYSNPGIAMLSYAVTAALKDAPQKDLRTLLRERVMQPIGVPDKEWSVGYGRTFTVDGLPLVGSWGGGSYTPRATARVARLMLRGGDWEGKQLVSKEAVRLTTADAGTPGFGGMGWWSNNERRYAKLPQDAFWGAGAGHQVVLIVPSRNLIAVRNGAELRPQPEFHDALNADLFEPLMEAISEAPPKSGAAPYPPSRLIARIDWAPKETIIRRAPGSDNWPLTWADDGHLY
ncbi:MAG TPA: serine hydrolase, partial [Gemmataceae bacterium]|nr:serine hydrolase [Gemmataceae bacterium]